MPLYEVQLCQLLKWRGGELYSGRACAPFQKHSAKNIGLPPAHPQPRERGLAHGAFGHATEAQTLDYLCILPDEIKALYLGLEL